MQSIQFNTWSDLACAQSRLRRQPVRAGHVPAPSPYAANSLPKLLSMHMVFIETLRAQSGYFSAPMSAPILLCTVSESANDFTFECKQSKLGFSLYPCYMGTLNCGYAKPQLAHNTCGQHSAAMQSKLWANVRLSILSTHQSSARALFTSSKIALREYSAVSVVPRNSS